MPIITKDDINYRMAACYFSESAENEIQSGELVNLKHACASYYAYFSKSL